MKPIFLVFAPKGGWFSKTLFVYGLVGMFVANRLSCFLFSAVYRHTDRHFVRHLFAQRTPKQIFSQKSQILIFFTISIVFYLYHGIGSEKVIITGMNKTFLSHFTITVFWRSYHFVACKGF